MPIDLKIAKTETEVDHALWVRHEVFVIEDGKFGGKPLPDERVVDRFDAFPNVNNIVVYEGDEPIATLRLLKETALGLPAFEYFDFSAYREQARAEMSARAGKPMEPVLGTAGMLAVRKPWRARRDVVRAMFKVGAGVSLHVGATHIVLAVNHETVGMYHRLGFEALSEPIWIEAIGNYIVPLAARVETFYAWAFGDLPKTPLNAFKDTFGRSFLRAGEVLFREGEEGDRAYIIDSGNIRISRLTPYDEELTLAQLGRGDLLGELALLTDSPRSATATAETHAELITLERQDFLRDLFAEPERLRELLEVFAERIRRMDDFAMVLAFSPPERRMEFALQAIKARARPDPKQPGTLVYKGDPLLLATTAAVDAEEAARFLDEHKARGELDYSAKRIRFFHH